MSFKINYVKLKSFGEYLYKNGFIAIFSSQVINKILLFSTNIIVVRLVTKTDYGLYSYAYNIISMFLLINGLGVLSGFLQYGSEYSKDKNISNAYERYSFRIGFISSVILSIIIFTFSIFSDNKIQYTSSLLMSLSLIPMFNFFHSFIETKLRINEQNKYYARLLNINSLAYFLGIVLGAISFGIIGIVISKYLAYVFSILYGYFVIDKKKNEEKTTLIYVLSRVEKKQFMRLSLVITVNNAISQMLYLIDVFIIGLIVEDTSVIASYKTATIIPLALTFIPMSVMIFVFPRFAQNSNNIAVIKENTKKVVGILFLVNLCIVTFTIIFSRLIILIVFGHNYLDAIQPFIILSIGYLISGSFRIPLGNILFSIKKVTFNLIVALMTGTTNIILNYFLINKYGSIGAAYTQLIVYSLASIMSILYLTHLFTKNKSKSVDILSITNNKE